MFKILIVDDEKIVIDAVKFILENNFKETTVSETARSGREAIEKAELFNPDIILMDIRMPGINGIDAIKEIKRIQPKTHFIIVSAYEQFDFAKEAVELKVDDYISKPIIKKNLINVPNNTMEKINDEKAAKKKELENIEKQESLLSLVEEGFIYSIMMNGIYDRILEQYRSILKLDESCGYVVVFEIGEKSDDLKEKNGSDFYQEIYEALKCKVRCMVGPEILNRVVAVISSPSKIALPEKKEAFEVIESVYKRLMDVFDNQSLRIGIGGCKKLEEIPLSYGEALIAVRNSAEKNIIHIDDIVSNALTISEYPVDAENKLLDKIESGDMEGTMNSFSIIYEWIRLNYINSFELGRAKIMELFVVLHRMTGLNRANSEDGIHYLLEIGCYEDFILLEKWCKEKLTRLVNNANMMYQKKNNRIIVRAKEFIYENYKRDITLEEVARVTNVTPHYLSRLFKEETGENFIEYLTSFRIRKAKKMMDSTNMNIKEICYEIGYSDPNYFSRLFKKVEKITPTDYMKKINKI